MSADIWLKCPICGKEKEDETKTVRVDGIYDINVTEDGKMDISSVTAYCKNCKKKFVH